MSNVIRLREQNMPALSDAVCWRREDGRTLLYIRDDLPVSQRGKAARAALRASDVPSARRELVALAVVASGVLAVLLLRRRLTSMAGFSAVVAVAIVLGLVFSSPSSMPKHPKVALPSASSPVTQPVKPSKASGRPVTRSTPVGRSGHSGQSVSPSPSIVEPSSPSLVHHVSTTVPVSHGHTTAPQPTTVTTAPSPVKPSPRQSSPAASPAPVTQCLVSLNVLGLIHVNVC